MSFSSRHTPGARISRSSSWEAWTAKHRIPPWKGGLVACGSNVQAPRESTGVLSGFPLVSCSKSRDHRASMSIRCHAMISLASDRNRVRHRSLNSCDTNHASYDGFRFALKTTLESLAVSDWRTVAAGCFVEKTVGCSNWTYFLRDEGRGSRISLSQGCRLLRDYDPMHLVMLVGLGDVHSLGLWVVCLVCHLSLRENKLMGLRRLGPSHASSVLNLVIVHPVRN